MSSVESAFDAFFGASGMESEHGETIVFRPFNRGEDALTIEGAIVNRDGLTGTNEVSGDGRVLDRPDERSERRSITVEVPSRYELQKLIDRPTSAIHPHTFVIDSQLFTVKKLLGFDRHFDTYLAAANDVAALRMPSRKG